MYIQIKTKNPIVWNPINPTDLQNIIIGVDLFIGNPEMTMATITYMTELGVILDIKENSHSTFSNDEAKQLEQMFNIPFTNWADYTKEFVQKVVLFTVGQKELFGLTSEDFEVM